jgi:hypothetical protein
MGVEFTCQDCGAWVFDAGKELPPIPEVCLSCLYLRTIPPEDRAAIQERFQALECRRAP